MLNNRKFLLQFFLILFCVPVFAQTSDIEKRIDDLLAKMTLDEKVGQLTQYAACTSVTEAMIRAGRVGSVMSSENVADRNRVQKIAVEETRLGIPLLFAMDVIHGCRTTFPIPLAEASSWNPELVKLSARISAWIAASEGYNWTFAPMVDIARDPRWGRIAEGSGEDPYLGSVMAAARVLGFQGESLSDPSSLIACAKHYVAYGAALGGRDYNTVDISERTLREIYLPPFKAAVDAGAGTLMSAFNDLNGIPASGNPFTLNTILRGEWGFKGFVVSDWNSIGELVYHKFASNKSEAALLALTAGVEMDMIGDSVVGFVYMPELANLVTSGKLPVSVVDEAVRRVLRIKFQSGLFEHPYTDTEYFAKNMPTMEARNEAALKVARESIVLLKNENNLLPLKKEIEKIAVIGPLADNQNEPIGPWACRPDTSAVITVLTGLREKLPDAQITYKQGCSIEGKETSAFREAVSTALLSDVVVMVLGESKDMSGEANSRTSIGLPGVQLELLKEIQKTGKPIVLVLMNGRPLTLEWEAENIPAIVEAWFLGDMCGRAVAEVLTGEYNPSGKLPVSFPLNIGQVPIFYNSKSTGRPFDVTNHFTSQYLDAPNEPLFSFGFGLSYTTFKYGIITLTKPVLSKDESCTVSVDVTNTGTRKGDEIVELYICDKVSSATRPVKELKGFQKIALQPNETKTVTFTVTPEMLAFYNNKMEWGTEPGEFLLLIGSSSLEKDLQSVPLLYK